MRKVIGIVGGVGPYAGLDFNKKIFDITPAKRDQEHLEVIMISASAIIGDRTEYLIDPENHTNPAEAIFSVILRLANAGADLVAIPCNTAHSPPIWDIIVKRLKEADIGIRLLHMLEETFGYLKKNYPELKKIGLLATKGTFRSGVYEYFSKQSGFELVIPTRDDIESIHSSIYDTEFGIKAKSNPVTLQATEILVANAKKLIEKGARAIILGCTEIPLAMDKITLSVPYFDPMEITAAALVRLADIKNNKF